MTGTAGASWKTYLVPAAFILCLLISLLLVIFRPFPHGHQYGLSLKLSAFLAGVWAVYRYWPRLIFTKGMRIFVLSVSLVTGIGGFIALNREAEIVPHYASVFAAIRSGQNPYTCGTIYHRADSDRPVPGNFNYPPMEIFPFYLLYLAAGTWNIWIVTFFKLGLQALAGLIFLWTFPRIRKKYLLPFLALFVCLRIQEIPAVTMVITAVVLLAVKKSGERSRRGDRPVIAMLFGVGLTTKFLVIPLMGAYYGNMFDAKRPRSIFRVAAEGGVALATAVLIMAPFGVANVFRETILFNLVLKERALYTTFFPNVLSGLFTWVRIPGLYPVAAIVILGLSIIAARKLDVFSAMMTTVMVFLLVAPTPRPEFFPLVIYVALVAMLANFEGQGTIPPACVRPAGREEASPAG